jgi:hypothetical protein
MIFSDLLVEAEITPAQVLMMRHTPTERGLKRVLPMLAADRQDLYNGYQRFQGPKVERALSRLVGKGYVASFIADGPGRALFVGLYFIADAKPASFDEFWNIPENVELRSLGMKADPWEHESALWFDLRLEEFHADWKGKLVINWPKPEILWCRPATGKGFEIRAIHETSALTADVKHWREINLSWAELRVLPASWRAKLQEWRAIYYIFDTADGRGYVGSAYGAENLLGRWLNYSASGHGGNKLLRDRAPETFRFTILERVSPDMEPEEVIRLETTWKERLHSRSPHGLNEN